MTKPTSSDGQGAASAALAVPKETTLDQRDALEIEALDAIERVNDPDQAEELLAKVKTVEAAARHAKWGKERVQRWQGYVIKAEHRYGELLPPKQIAPKPGPGRGKHVSGAHTFSDAERTKQSQARKVAEVPKAKVDEYVKTDPSPTKAGLLRAHSSQPQPRVRKPKPVPKPMDPRNRQGKKPTKAEHKGVLWLLHDTVTDYAAKLERIDPRVCNVTDSADLEVLVFIRDALIDLDIWKGDTEMIINTKIGDEGIREKIATLRNPNGKYPAELKRCEEAADRLEQRLKNKLSA